MIQKILTIALITLITQNLFAQESGDARSRLLDTGLAIETLTFEDLQMPFENQTYKKKILVPYKGNVIVQTLGFYAAFGKKEHREARKEAQPIATEICNFLGGSLEAFEIVQPEIYGLRRSENDEELELYYKVLNSDEGTFDIKRVALETKLVINGVLDSIFTSIWAYDKDVIEHHYVMHWEFSQVECLGSAN